MAIEPAFTLERFATGRFDVCVNGLRMGSVIGGRRTWCAEIGNRVVGYFPSPRKAGEAIVAEHSTEYQRVLDNLQRELKYKAHRKGATGIVSFTIQTVPLTLPSQYRILVVGTAIRHEQASGQKT